MKKRNRVIKKKELHYYHKRIKITRCHSTGGILECVGEGATTLHKTTA